MDGAIRFGALTAKQIMRQDEMNVRSCTVCRRARVCLSNCDKLNTGQTQFASTKALQPVVTNRTTKFPGQNRATGCQARCPCARVWLSPWKRRWAHKWHTSIGSGVVAGHSFLTLGSAAPNNHRRNGEDAVGPAELESRNDHGSVPKRLSPTHSRSRAIRCVGYIRQSAIRNGVVATD